MSDGDKRVPPTTQRLNSLRASDASASAASSAAARRFVPRPSQRRKADGTDAPEPKVKAETQAKAPRPSHGGRGDRKTEHGGRGGRGGAERDGGRGRGGRGGRGRAPLPMGRVAFEGSMAAGSSGTSTSSVSAAKMKKPVSSDAIGISVLDETLGNTHLDVEEPIQWPPVIESTMQPMSLPFGRPPKHFSVTDDEAGGAVFCDELGNFIVQDDDLFFIQLPTTLPYAQKTATAAKDDDEAPVKPANKDAEGLELFDNALNTMPSGYLGKIQIHKSGKAVLVLGDKTFDIAPAQPPTFYEELVSMDTKDRLLSHLGPIANHLVVTPDFESLLA